MFSIFYIWFLFDFKKNMIIKNNFEISLDKFINFALYDKKKGYYMQKNPFGLRVIL